MRFLATLAAVTVPVLLVAAPIESFAASCQAMRAELARVSSGGGGGQAAALEKRARAMGCRGQSRFGVPRQCMSLNAEIARARGGGGDSRRARQLQQRIATQCNGNQVREARDTRQQRRNNAWAQPARAEPDSRFGGARRPSGPGNFFASLFGGFVQAEPYRPRRGVEVVMPEDSYRRERHQRTDIASAQEHGDAESRAARQNWSRNAPRGSNFKTWCVRLCDGFYFPASQNTSSSAFPRQLAMCVNQCPSADVSLYAHNASSPPERMVSAITGEPYVNLPTAFAYRKTFNPTCGCGIANAPGAEGPVLEANNDASEVRIDMASTDQSVPEGVARVKSLIEPTGFGDGGTASTAAAYVPEASDSLAVDAAVAVANAQANGDASALAAAVTRTDPAIDDTTTALALASPETVVPESQLAAASATESGAPMTLMPGTRPVETEAKGGGVPPTDVSGSLRFRQVGPRFYAARESAVVLPSQDLP